ncbi:peptidase c13 family protein [Toxoplasma gondii VEG]|uniref:GPI-anchor transamidase, putative n=1 Tax=Toxoplasma gondii (strain ATCC 50861 / VEG) TaxID=432359 RepID=V4Z8A7_TOXGV|nr:peptidase c13 family protein [Toxoplasma gondii VEG]CEL72159.1 TPA: GPI-anchor transamidase, putative [Toxoplasma gondii VEG]
MATTEPLAPAAASSSFSSSFSFSASLASLCAASASPVASGSSSHISPRLRFFLFSLLSLCLSSPVCFSRASSAPSASSPSSSSSPSLSSFFSGDFRNNWAVIVNTSRYWYNYRHTANALSIYHTVKRLGIPDSQIILMLSDDHACSPRNFFPGRIFNDHTRTLNLYGAGDRSGGGSSVEVDYRGDEVQVATLLQLLAGRHNPATPRGKRLLTDENSQVLLYLSGHGGDGFLKFQDWEEISSVDLADAVAQMKAQRRFREMLLIAETCQGSTLLDAMATAGVLGLASSGPKESSYSHHADGFLGVAVIDRWTYYTLQFFEKSVRDASSSATFEQLMNSYSRKQLLSTASVRTELFGRPLGETKLTEFFATASSLHATHGLYPIKTQRRVSRRMCRDRPAQDTQHKRGNSRARGETSSEREETSSEREETSIEREENSIEREETSIEREENSIEREENSIEREENSIEREETSIEREENSIEREENSIERGGRNAVRVGTYYERHFAITHEDRGDFDQRGRNAGKAGRTETDGQTEKAREEAGRPEAEGASVKQAVETLVERIWGGREEKFQSTLVAPGLMCLALGFAGVASVLL